MMYDVPRAVAFSQSAVVLSPGNLHKEGHMIQVLSLLTPHRMIGKKLVCTADSRRGLEIGISPITPIRSCRKRAECFKFRLVLEKTASGRSMGCMSFNFRSDPLRVETSRLLRIQMVFRSSWSSERVCNVF